LVANAFDALDEKPAAEKKIRISVDDWNGQVRCRIEDSGNGIPDHMHDQVFRFLKTSKSTGMGLGLWLTKYIVEKNLGKITVSRSELGGAMFTIEFPAMHDHTFGMQ
jgi:C4-dicarboxylate-specific signal transduction histidine kinase